MGSVQFQRVPCSSLYFSRSIHPFQCLVNANCRVLICCTRHFQNGSLFFVYFAFLCWKVSSVSNFRPDTRGRRRSLFRLTCSVVLWGGKDTADKHRWCVWGVLSVRHPANGTCAFPVYTAQAPGCSAGELSKAHPGFCALPRSQLLRFRFSGTPQGHRLGWALHIVPFPGLRSSGDQVLGECAAPGGLCVLVTSLVPASWFPGYTTRAMSQVCPGSPLSG